MAEKTNSIMTSLLTKYTQGTLKLGEIGNSYRKQMKDKDLAEENLLKVYRAYTIVGWVLGIASLIIPFFIMYQTKHATWMVLTPLAYAIPLSLQWSMRYVLGITSYQYTQWRKSKKAAKKTD
jgi:hypothetical protein